MKILARCQFCLLINNISYCYSLICFPSLIVKPQFPLVSGFEGSSFKSDKVWRKTFAGFSQVRVNSNCSLICFEFWIWISVSKRWTSKTSAPSFKLKMFSRSFARVNSALIHNCAHRRKLSKVSTSFPQRFRLPFNYTHLTQKTKNRLDTEYKIDFSYSTAMLHPQGSDSLLGQKLIHIFLS